MSLPSPSSCSATGSSQAPAFLSVLPDSAPSFRCANCSAELSLQDELVSRSFSGSRGPAYLVRTVINTRLGPKTSKQLLTGKHTIAPLTCKGCDTELGWTYFTAPEQSQKYKEMKSILEKDKIYKARLARVWKGRRLIAVVVLTQDNKWSL